MNFHQCRPAHTIGLRTPSLSRRNDTTIRGHKGTTHTASHSRHCSLCAVLGNGRHNPTLMRRHQRVAGEAWRVRATSWVGASEPALPRSLRCDLVLCCCMMSYSVLILSTTVAIPQGCRRSLRRHHHPRRTAAAATAAVRRLLCSGCGWCLLRLFLKKLIKNWLSVVVMIVVMEPGRAAVPQLIWRAFATATSASASAPAAAADAAAAAAAAVLLLRCCCCCCCCAAVLTLSHACSKGVLRSLLREIDAAVRGFCTHHRMARFLFASCFLCGFFIANSAKCMPE